MALSKITASVARDKSNPPVKGLVQEIVLINWDDLLKANITLNVTTPKSLIDAITLTSGTQGYKIEGHHQVIDGGYDGEFPSDEVNGTKHMLENIPWLDNTAAGRQQLELIREGARFFAVVKSFHEGASQAEAFHFYGYDVGIEATADAKRANNADGVPVITLGTPESLKEAHAPRLLLETDYATTQTEFAALFVEA